MPIIIYAILLGLFLLGPGCGNHTKITYHEVTPEQLLAISGGASNLGHARWKDYKYEVLCDISLMSEDRYSPDCYTAVVRHERRHCYEFNFHPGIPEDMPECFGK